MYPYMLNSKYCYTLLCKSLCKPLDMYYHSVLNKWNSNPDNIQ